MEFEQWGHVSTHTNPADCTSRGLKPTELNSYDLWWNGPDWLSKPVIQSKKPDIFDTHEEERVKSFSVIEKPNTNFEWMKFLDLSKLLKLISLCRRFLKMTLPSNERKLLPKQVTSAVK